MRIAVNSTGEVGKRAALVLLAERDLTALGVYGEGPAGERRMMRITDLSGFDLLVTDDPTPGAIARIALEDGVDCVLAVDEIAGDVADGFAAAGRRLLLGANLRGIATALAAHESARVAGPAEVSAAWTVPGSALRRGVAVGFPEPVGARWGTPTEGGIAVPLGGSWAAAAATVTGVVEGRRVERLVGVADVADHLSALALAAGALVVARGAAPTGPSGPADVAEPLLAAALSCGMGVAAYTA